MRVTIWELKTTIIVHPGKITAPYNIKPQPNLPKTFTSGDGLAEGDDNFERPLSYQVRWIPVSDTNLEFISDLVPDELDPDNRTHDYTIAGLDAEAQYNISVRSYKKKPASNQYDVEVSDWVEFDPSEPAPTTRPLYTEDEGESLSITEGHTEQYELSRWIVPSSLRPAGAAPYTIDIDSSNDNIFTAEHVEVVKKRYILTISSSSLERVRAKPI